MKVKLDEFEKLLAQLKNMPAGDARVTMLNTLKSAEVYEVDKDGKESPITVKIMADEADAKSDADAATAVDETAIERLVQKKLDEIRKANPPAGNPLGEKPGQKSGIIIPAEVKRFGTIKNFSIEKRHGMSQDERAYGFGQWAMATMGSDTAKAWCQEHGVKVVKLHSESVNSAGGYLVPDQFSTDLIDLKEKYGVVRRLFDAVPMTPDTLKIPRRVGGLTASFVGEGTAGTESTMSFDQIQLVAKDLMVLTRLTNQVNSDSLINWSDRLAYEASYANTLKEDQCGFLGTGVSSYGGIVGVVTALTNKWSASVAGTATGITKAASTTLASLVLADFDNAVGSLPQFADTPNTCWVMHRSVYFSVVEKLVQAAGGVPAYEVRQGNRAPRPIFKGYPVEFSQIMPSTTAATTIFALLGDFSLAASFGDRQQDQIAFSDQASIGGQSLWERNEMGVRCIERMDIVVHDVGDGTTPGPIVAVATG